MRVEKRTTGIEVHITMSEEEAGLLATYMVNAISFASPGGGLAEKLYDEIIDAGITESTEFKAVDDAGLVDFELSDE